MKILHPSKRVGRYYISDNNAGGPPKDLLLKLDSNTFAIEDQGVTIIYSICAPPKPHQV